MNTDLFWAAPCGLQVWADVRRRQPERWFALDDDWLHWPAWCRYQLILTNEIAGISEPTVLSRIRERLAKVGHE